MDDQIASAISLPSDTDSVLLADLLGALANSAGGAIRLDRGTASDDELMDRVREASLLAAPALILPLPIVDDHGIAVHIPRGMPHVFAVGGRFLAHEDGAIRPLAPRELRRLLVERRGLSYEEEIAHGATLDDLDSRAVESYVVRIGGTSSEAVLAQRGCTVQINGEWVPTNAGILLFGKNPQRFVRGAFITAARFAGLEMSDVF